MNIAYCAILGFGLAGLLVRFLVWQEGHYMNNLDKNASQELREFRVYAARKEEAMGLREIGYSDDVYEKELGKYSKRELNIIPLVLSVLIIFWTIWILIR